MSAPRQVEREESAARGVAAVESSRYSDTFDACAESVIADILHAVAAAGYDPQDVLNHAVIYYAEERE